MDPNANLDQQLELAKAIVALVDNSGENIDIDRASNIIAKAEELADRVLALDHWLTGQGFMPERWAVRETERVALIGQRAFEAGRLHGIEQLASAVKKTLDEDSLASLIAALSRKGGN